MSVRLIYYFISYFAIAFGLALALTPLMRPLAFRLGAVDKGGGRRVHTGITPRLGGIGMFAAFMLPLIFSLTRGQWDNYHNDLVGIIIASTIVFCVGTYDDLRGTTIRNKLIAEVLAALLIYSFGIRITVISSPFGAPIVLGWWSLPVTLLWIIVVTNAMNLIDGLDGLAAGTGILIALTLVLLPGPDTHTQLVYVILAGSMAGFLFYNFPPASIFMGDSGSLFIGFCLGALSIVSSHKATAMATIMIPVIAFAFPLMDMFYAVLRRYYRGLPLGEADREHIHHMLLKKGLSKKKVLFLLYFINSSMMMAALLMMRRELNAGFVHVIVIVAVAVIGLRALGYIEFLPSIKELLRNHEIGRKRKYFTYVVKRFRRNTAKCRHLEEIKPHLTVLMKEYKFNSVKIYLYPFETDTLAYTYTSDTALEAEEPLVLSFPIIGANCCLGNVHITKERNDDYFLCASDLIRAISEELRRVTEFEKNAQREIVWNSSKLDGSPGKLLDVGNVTSLN
jgi:UDP-GlcNAc:undecaprenyl-phosphate GlcNAc-1-phosphate transferase